MTLKARLAWIVVLLMSALVVSYSLVLLGEMRERADAETEAALPWIVELLPSHLDAMAHGEAGSLEPLVHLVRGLERIRHVSVQLHTPDGRLLARAPSRPAELPGWIRRKERAGSPLRKDVTFGSDIVAYFEVRPASDDEFAEVWEDFVRSSLLVVMLSMLAGSAIVWLAFRAFLPVDRILTALRELGEGTRKARLPQFRTPEMDEIAKAFNRMAGELEAAQGERQSLMRKLLESEEHTRRSVAHDLHDDLSPYLVALQPLGRVLQAKCAQREGVDDIAQLAQTLVSHQSKMLSTLRGILVGLHPPELEAMGLRGAIEQLVNQRRSEAQGRVRVSMDLVGDWQGFGAVIDASIYRMVQECLTNAMRHASATWVHLHMTCDAEAIDISVLNDGVNQLASGMRQGLGTIGMRERCLALGGQFEGRPTPPSGWQVSIRLPVESPSATSSPA
jgi:two-component system sensor histidine kinase UhpB